MKIVKVDELKEFEGLDASIYSKKKFIEFIARYLKSQGGISNEYTFSAGKNMRVDAVELSDTLTNVHIAYEKSLPPTGNITQFTAEYGQTFARGEKTIELSVTRKTYPLEFVRQPELLPAINLTKEELDYLQNGDTLNASGSNDNVIGPDDTIMADGGSFSDTTEQTGSLISRITRKTRSFWGMSALKDPSEDFFNEDKFQSGLSGVPSKISVYTGSAARGFIKEYLTIVTTGNVKVFQNGGEILMDKVTANIGSYQGDPSYRKTYNIFTSRALFEPGPADFEIK